MAVSERNMKRKVNELEDITNTNTNYNKKLKQMNFKKKLQQRSPSPLEIDGKNYTSCRSSSSSPNKSSFKRDYGKSVTFENSPLLTPKEEDYQDDEDIIGLDNNVDMSFNDNDDVDHQHDDIHPINRHDNKHSDVKVNANMNANDLNEDKNSNDTTNDDNDNDNDQSHKLAGSNTTPTSQANNLPQDNVDYNHELTSNLDYIALTSSLRLLNNNKTRIESEILQLSNLLNYYSNLDTKQYDDHQANHDEIIKFFIKLIKNELNLPKQNKILKSPIINWSKYNLEVEKNGDCSINKNFNNKPLFKTLNLFDNNNGSI